MSEDQKAKLIVALGYLLPTYHNLDDKKKHEFYTFVMKPIEEVTGYKIPEGYLGHEYLNRDIRRF